MVDVHVFDEAFQLLEGSFLEEYGAFIKARRGDGPRMMSERTN